MRYLVTARLKAGLARALSRAIDHPHPWARLGRRRRVPPQHGRSASAAGRSSGVGGNVLLRDASRRGTPVLAAVLRSAQRKGRTRPQPVPSRNRGRALGVLELRLYGQARRRVGAARDAIRAWRVASRGVVARRHRPAGSRGGPDAFARAARRALVLRRVLRCHSAADHGGDEPDSLCGLRSRARRARRRCPGDRLDGCALLVAWTLACDRAGSVGHRRAGGRSLPLVLDRVGAQLSSRADRRASGARDLDAPGRRRAGACQARRVGGERAPRRRHTRPVLSTHRNGIRGFARRSRRR